ncbi:MAG TPA: hypothetical protein VMD09_10565 [Solirubrobacteraceae bacterium]|nr:hypothetical protein [Solirubrobacteraceae bacterium]
MPNPVMLFQRGDLRLSLQEQEKGLIHEIEAVPEDHVLHVDEAAWAMALAERWAVEAPTLKVADIWMDEPQPVQVDVSWDHYRRVISDPSRPAYVPGHQTTVHIPFSGEKHVFQLRPSSYTLNPPHANVSDRELRLVIEYPDDNPANIKAETDELVKKVEQHLDAARMDIEYWNSGLLNTAQMAIRSRRERIERHHAHVQQTGLPVGPRRDPSKTYIVDVIVRRPAPPLPAANQERPMELEPVLADDIYDHILAVIRQHTLSMEQSPHTYAGMGEEDRRRVILDALNTHYRGLATAEAFNFGGKTDIRIAHDGRNLFIAECKFWSGQKGFIETLDQLFNYQAWRDTKLAVLMFVREHDLTTIIERGRAALEAHPQFVSLERPASETELRATMRWRGDGRRRADLNVFFISTPTE